MIKQSNDKIETRNKGTKKQKKNYKEKRRGNVVQIVRLYCLEEKNNKKKKKSLAKAKDMEE